MLKFLEKYNHPKLNEEEAESLNRPITITADEIEAVIKNLPTHKALDQTAAPENSTKPLRKS